MRKKLYPLGILILIALGVQTVAQKAKSVSPKVDASVVFEEVNGLVSIEAEFFYKQTKTDKRCWYHSSPFDKPAIDKDIDSLHLSGASNDAYIEVLPDTRVTHDDVLVRGENFSNIPGKLAIVHYKVKFNSTGRYYVWVRTMSTGSEDNGLHVGIDDTWPEHGKRMQWCEGRSQWTWASRQRTKEVHCGIEHEIYLDVQQPGIHDIQFSMREDGFEFDKFILTTDSLFVPKGKGASCSFKN